MNHTIYLCEKANQARDIAKALGVVRDNGDWIETKAGAVSWAQGHLIGLVDPDDYDPAWKSWSQSAFPTEFKHKPRNPRAAAQLKTIAGLLKGCSRVVLCTDPDREGELIGREILRHLRYKGKIERALLHALTQSAILKAMASLVPSAQTEPLYWAALGRSYADWLVGMNLTRAASRNLAAPGTRTVLSIGRVQTPTLALVVRREREIRSFVKKDYFEVEAVVRADGRDLVLLHAPQGPGRIFAREDAEAVAKRAGGAIGPVSVRKERGFEPPPELHALGSLQREAGRRLGWEIDKTLDVAQELYDKHKLVTYPRSGCRVLPDEFKSDAPALLDLLSSLPELAQAAEGFKGGATAPILRKRSYDSGKVGAHHAIIPTGVDPATVAGLSQDARDLFVVIARRYLAAHMPDCSFEATEISWEGGGDVFSAKGRLVLDPGWRAAEAPMKAEDDGTEEEGGEEEKEGTVADVSDGAQGEGLSAKVLAKTTQPPSRFSSSGLGAAMENVARFVVDPAKKSRLRATAGLGTDATRAPIVRGLKEKGFLILSKGKFSPSDAAMELIEAVEAHAPEWADPGTTAEWEDGLDLISKGEGRVGDFLDGISAQIKAGIAALDAADVLPADRIVSGKPKTGGRYSSKGGKTPAPSAATGGGSAARTDLKVSYADREKAKGFGARWDNEKRTWYAPPGSDLSVFKKAGFLK